MRRVYRNGRIGRSLSGDAINTIARGLAILAGIPDAEIVTAHSLRAGGATIAYAARQPVSAIAQNGRWRPDSPVVLRYIRAADGRRANPMRRTGL